MSFLIFFTSSAARGSSYSDSEEEVVELSSFFPSSFFFPSSSLTSFLASSLVSFSASYSTFLLEKNLQKSENLSLLPKLLGKKGPLVHNELLIVSESLLYSFGFGIVRSTQEGFGK